MNIQERFKKVIEIFNRAQTIKNKRFKEFLNFYLYCIKEFPYELKNKLEEVKYSPIEENTDKYENDDDYRLTYTYNDYVWWKEQYEIDNFTVLPIKTIMNDIMAKVLDILDSMPIVDDDELRNKGLEILEDDNN